MGRPPACAGAVLISTPETTNDRERDLQMGDLTLDPQVTRRPLTVEDFHRMGDAGIFGAEDRVELVEGELINMAPVNSLHAGTLNRLNGAFSRLYPKVIVAVQNPLVLGAGSELYPDLMLLRPRPDDYAGANPGPGDVLLVAEVAHATLRYDSGAKARLYAQHGVVELWVLAAEKKELLVHREAGPEGYRDVRTLGAGTAIAPLLLPDLTVRVDDLFPRA